MRKLGRPSIGATDTGRFTDLLNCLRTLVLKTNEWDAMPIIKQLSPDLQDEYRVDDVTLGELRKLRHAFYRWRDMKAELR
jgi:hypothetical protein